MNVTSLNDLNESNYEQLEIHYHEKQGLLWLTMQPEPRPCFNPTLLKSLSQYQHLLRESKGKIPAGGDTKDVKYQVLSSGAAGVFNYGGDLGLFMELIKKRDRNGMLRYAKACIDVLYPNIVSYNLPITTISLVQGSALGGGFEAALSSNVIIAERQAEFGLPEIFFNLFPGMGAYSMLARKVSPILAEKMILSGRIYSAEELHEMGVVDVIVDTDQGEEAVYDYIKSHKRQFNGFNAVQTRVRHRVNPINYDELLDVCNIWVDTALHLDSRDIRIMQRLVNAQNKQVDAQQEERDSQSIA